MLGEADQDGAEVVFKEHWSLAFSDRAHAIEVLMVAVAFAVFSWLSRGQVGLQIALGIAAFILLLIGIRGWRKSRVSRLRLVLREEYLHFGNLAGGVEIPYEQVSMIRVDGLPVGGSLHRLTLEWEPDGEGAICLERKTADECLHAVHGLCETVPAIDARGRPMASVDQARAEESSVKLASLFGAQARRLVLALAFCLIIWLGLIVAMVLRWPNSARQVELWLLIGGLTILLIAGLVSRQRLSQRASELTRSDRPTDQPS